MDKTTLNAQLVATGLKRVFYHLKSVDCERSNLWKSFRFVAMKRTSSLILLLVRFVFRRYG